MLKYCLNRYKTQKMCDKAFDDFLPALKFVPDWFDILFFDEESGNVTFSSDEMGVLSVDLKNINLDDVDFDVNTLRRKCVDSICK